MSQSDKAAAVPSSRLARLARLGSLASGVAGGMLAEGVRQWSRCALPGVSNRSPTSCRACAAPP